MTPLVVEEWFDSDCDSLLSYVIIFSHDADRLASAAAAAAVLVQL